jgi:hypothetical protein
MINPGHGGKLDSSEDRLLEGVWKCTVQFPTLLHLRWRPNFELEKLLKIKKFLRVGKF